MTKNNINGFWDKVTLVCGCHNEEYPKMMVQTGPSSLFYSCPKYYPENRTSEEYACANRINLIDYEEMLTKLTDMIIGDDLNYVQINLENMRFKNKKGDIEFTVVKHDKEGNIIVSFKSKKALR